MKKKTSRSLQNDLLSEIYLPPSLTRATGFEMEGAEMIIIVRAEPIPDKYILEAVRFHYI